jgi:hypothetical protein
VFTSKLKASSPTEAIDSHCGVAHGDVSSGWAGYVLVQNLFCVLLNPKVILISGSVDEELFAIKWGQSRGHMPRRDWV